MNIFERIYKLERAVAKLMSRTFIIYDKGTYTPTYLGGTTPGVTTYTLQQGRWVRKGKEITVTGAVAWTAATGTGNARISLPFTADAINFTGSVRMVNVTFAAGSPQVEFNGTDYFEMRSPATNAGGTVVAVEAAGNIIFTIVYFLP